MSADIIARGLAARLRATAPRLPVIIAIFGQSNEHHAVTTSDRAAWPQAFQSLRNPGVAVPFGPALTALGGWWPKVYDDMWDWGYDLQIVNGAIGGLGFFRQAAGAVQTRNNGVAYYAKRLPLAGNTGDRGDYGDVVISTNGTRVFQCTTGNVRTAVNGGPLLNPQGLRLQDYINLTGALVSGGSEPATFNTASVGDVVTDGGLAWTCVSTLGLTGGAYLGCIGTVMTEAQIGYGFDPLGLLQRHYEAIQQVRGVSRKIVYIQNGQADLGLSASGYGNALQSIGRFYLDRGCEVMFGLTIYSPGSANATSANYGNLWTGVQNAATALSATYPGKVWTGPNLYTAMGTTGPMASGGAFLQADNIHLNGAGAVGPDVAGVSCAGRYVADAVKALLPRAR